LRQGSLERLHGLVGRQLLGRERRAVGHSRVLIRSRLGGVILRLQPRQPRHDPGLDAPAALTIANPVLQNAVEQRAPFLRRAATVAAGELEHRVLDAVEGVFIVPQGDARHTESALLYAGEKAVECPHLLQNRFLHGRLRPVVPPQGRHNDGWGPGKRGEANRSRHARPRTRGLRDYNARGWDRLTTTL